MIQKTELRVGNSVTTEYGAILTVETLEPTEAWVATNEDANFASYEELEPIPLTEEWLSKHGFYSCGDDLNTWRLKSTAFSGYLFEVELNEPHYFKVCDLLVNHYQKIQFVHQVQNLHFYITGTELTPISA